ncbi:MAG: CAF17-like 4Fe-4S cluster assembly/insertion protein YgfZ [bacterium]
MKVDEIVQATRRGATLFRMEDRGLLEVRGEDRVRWLDGMISADVEGLVSSGPGSGCYAMLLTSRGAIVADLHVGLLDETFLLESARHAIPRIQETLDRFIIADDVTLADSSDESVVWGLEGPLSESILEIATGIREPLEPEGWADRRIGERSVRIASFGFSGERAFQLRIPPEASDAVVSALEAAAEEAGLEGGLPMGSAEALEVLRVEAGIPLLGAELDEEVLPPEARLDHALPSGKGCYVGQEIVARLRSRGQVNHLLVGLRIEADALPPAETKLMAEGRATGEITSAVVSPTEGRIALGYVRRAHATEGTRIDFDGGEAQVAALPFSRPSSRPSSKSSAQPSSDPRGQGASPD